MNRKNLTAAVLAGLAGAAGIVGSAQAVNINPDGLGQVLIYPYYTTNGGNMTLLSVVNTTENGKAVKVRFKEGKNSREVLDFNLYMSPYDVWTASVKLNADGVPQMKTADTSCTAPYIYDWDHDPSTPGYTPYPGMTMIDGKQPFLPWAMNDTELGDDFYRPIADANEGYFEMIEMGTIEDGSPAHDAILHDIDGDNKGIPADCEFITDLWVDPDIDDDTINSPWEMTPDMWLEGPSGGLFGGAAVVNVQNGTMYSYDAKAIDGFNSDTTLGAADFLHAKPGDSSPSLNSGDQMMGYVFMDGGASVSASFSRGVDAISYVFMHDQLMNEYTTEMGVGAGTEWVMNFPTKSFYVYPDESGSATVLPPFTSLWDEAELEACESVTLDSIWDREEQTFPITIDPTVPGGPIVSPKPPVEPDPIDPVIPFTLCYEVSVIQFGEIVVAPEGTTSDILGSSNFHIINNEDETLGFEYGWARLNLQDYIIEDPVDPGKALNLSRLGLGGLLGLPVTGFAVQKFGNAYLGDGGDVLANYGGIFQHKATRKAGSAAVMPPVTAP